MLGYFKDSFLLIMKLFVMVVIRVISNNKKKNTTDF